LCSVGNGRWDEAAAEQCPEYLTNLYKNILATVKTIEEELKLQGNKHAELVKTLVWLLSVRSPTEITSLI
jgi:hypothetical protein